MGNFLVFICLLILGLIQHANAAIVPSGVPQIQWGSTSANSTTAGVFAIPIGDLKSTAAVGDATPGEWFMIEYGGNPTTVTCSPFRKDGQTYQAGSNGTLCVLAYYDSGSNNQNSQLFSASATFADNVTCSSQSSPVYQSGNSGQYVLSSGPTAGVPSVIPIMYKFGASTYPGAQILNSGSFQHHIRLLCKEL